MDDIVSIIIPAHNTAAYLARCVESVAAQTWPARLLDIIIVENGSSDDTGACADALKERYANVRVIRLEKGDVSGARNAGIAAAKGAYIGFVDSDDRIEEEMVETLMRLIREKGTHIAQIARNEIAEDGTPLPDIVRPPEEESVITRDDFLKSLLLHEGDASFCTKLTDRSLFTEKTLFAEGMRNEDFELWLRMIDKVDGIAASPLRCYNVLYRAGSGSRPDPDKPDYFPQGYTDIVRGADEAEQKIAADYPQYAEIARRFALVQRLDYLLHIPLSRMTADNAHYRSVVGYLRAHRRDIRTNPYLTEKQRKNLLRLSLAPKTARRVHASIMRSRKKGGK